MVECRDIHPFLINDARSLKELYHIVTAPERNFFEREGYFIPRNHSDLETRKECRECHNEHYGIFHGKRNDPPFHLTPGLKQEDITERFDHVHGLGCTSCHSLPIMSTPSFKKTVTITQLSLESPILKGGLEIFQDPKARKDMNKCIEGLIDRSPHKKILIGDVSDATQTLEEVLRNGGMTESALNSLEGYKRTHALSYIGLLDYLRVPDDSGKSKASPPTQRQDPEIEFPTTFASVVLALFGAALVAGAVSSQNVSRKRRAEALSIKGEAKKVEKERARLEADPEALQKRRAEELLRAEFDYYDALTDRERLDMLDHVLEEVRRGDTTIDADFISRTMDGYKERNIRVEHRARDTRGRRGRLRLVRRGR